MRRIKTAIVGCGNIATQYAEQIRHYTNIELVGFQDLVLDRAAEFSNKHGGRVYETLDDVLNDQSVELIVNLTIHNAHFEVIERALKAGKHVHSEKPLSTSAREATILANLAQTKGLRLSSAPSTFLGEAVQTAWRELRTGKLGCLRALYAEINHGRIEAWHPNPEPFYKVGPVWDVAVYPLGVWAALCGPMRKVTAVGKTLLAKRATKEGVPFVINNPDFYVAVIEFQNGAVGRLTANLYVEPSKQDRTMEFHGDAGSLFLGSSYMFDAAVEHAPAGGTFSPISLVREPFKGVEFARGVEDLANAILEDRPHRCDAEMALHVIEVIEAIHTSAQSQTSVSISSSFREPPQWNGHGNKFSAKSVFSYRTDYALPATALVRPEGLPDEVPS